MDHLISAKLGDGHIEIVLGAKSEHLSCLSIKQEPRAMSPAEGKGLSLPFVRESS